MRTELMGFAAFVVAATVIAVTVALGGCRGERASVEDVAPHGSPLEFTDVEAKDLVARCAEVPVVGVKLTRHEVTGSIADITAEVISRAGQGERVFVRYDLGRDLLLGVTWRDRLVFGQPETVSEAQAQKVARELFKRWFPQVPVRMVQGEMKKLHSPFFVTRWGGMVNEGIQSGDYAAVIVCSSSGLPYVYQQRVAPQRPKPEDIKVNRAQALIVARRALRESRKDADELDPQADLILSSALHPDEGPVWRVRYRESDGTSARDVIFVDAMGGQVLEHVRAPRGDFEAPTEANGMG